jgi:ABC-type bacteriocin/lantibiotic exporter with double-glycine peptidase domain
MLRRFSCVIASESNQCGAAALATIARHYGKEVPVAELSERLHTDLQGTRLSELLRVARELGFDASSGVVKHRDLRAIPLPAIVHLSRPPRDHYVTLHKMTSKFAIVADPALGIRQTGLAEFDEEWSGSALLLTPSPQFVRQRNRSPHHALANLLKCHRPLIISVAATASLVTLTTLALGCVFGLMLEKALQPFSLGGDLRWLAWATASIVTIRFVVSLVRQHLTSRLRVALETRLADLYCSQLLNMPYSFFTKRTLGDLFSRADDSAALGNSIANTILPVLIDFAIVMGCLPVLLAINLRLGISLAVSLPVLATVWNYANEPISRNDRLMKEAYSRYTSTFIGLIENIRTIKVYSAELRRREILAGQHRNLQTLKSAKSHLAALINGGISSVNALVMIAILLGGLHLIQMHQLNAARLVLFYAVASLFAASAERVIPLFSSVAEALFCIARLGDLDHSESERIGGLVAPPNIYNLGIELQNVHFSWRADCPVLQSISLKIRQGAFVAIVGETGSGKTTLGGIIGCLYQPTSGSILLGGRQVQEFSLSSLRSGVAIVFQDADLFEGSIRDNITMGDQKIDPRHLHESAALACAHEFIMQKPRHYDHQVGTGGNILSGGQAQRIAIARALYKKPDLLILDEATSNLDADTERQVVNNICEERRGKTTIMITHRLRATVGADWIIVLHAGKILQEGTHAYLLSQQGQYRDAWILSLSSQNDVLKTT